MHGQEFRRTSGGERRFEGVRDVRVGGRPSGGEVSQASVSGVGPSVNLTEAHGERGCSQQWDVTTHRATLRLDKA